MCAADPANRAKNPYEEAVARFEALLAVSAADNRLSRHRKTAQAGIPKSTGYRLFEAMEYERLLSQNSAGDFSLGDLGWRIGLSAWGFGDVSPFVPVTVRYLKTHARRLAFLGVLVQDNLHLTAYSSNRGMSFRPVSEDGIYMLSGPEATSQRTVRARDASGTSEYLVLADVARRSSGLLVLGLIALSQEDARRLDATGLLNDTAHRFRAGAIGHSLAGQPAGGDASR